MSNAIITGATGFVGSHLCKYLLRNQWDICIIARDQSDFTNLKKIHDKINVYIYAGNTANLISFFKKTKADVVFHLAACVVGQHNSENLDMLIDSNIKFGAQILEAMRLSETKILVNTGTYWQHYESKEYSPVNLYAATKEAYEKIIQYYTEAEDIRVINLNLFDVYGEGDRRLKLLNKLHQIASSMEEFNLSPGEQYMDFVHIDDVVRAYESAYEYLVENRNIKISEFGIGSKKLMKLKDIIATFEEVYDTKLNIVWGGLEYRKRQIMNPWQDYKTLPNWKCEVGLSEGLKRIKEHSNNN